MSELTGKELEIEVAKKVMGWEVVTAHAEATVYPYLLTFAYEDCLYKVDRLHQRAWTPRRDMNDAWEVDRVEWRWTFREHNMGVDARLRDLYDCQLYFGYAEWDDFGKLEAYCHARLRAALKAKGGER